MCHNSQVQCDYEMVFGREMLLKVVFAEIRIRSGMVAVVTGKK